MVPHNERNSNLEVTGTFRYHSEIDANSNSTHANIVRLVGTNKRVLELGCAGGHMSRVLRERGCQVTAIELDGAAAQFAAPFCERVVVGDLDHLDFERELGRERFDVIVAADVLEHLKEPGKVLGTLGAFLRPEGFVVVSVPNVAHISVRLALLSGNFPYGETGLLDQTHLRFFTRDSVEQLFDRAGFVIGDFQRIKSLPREPDRFEVPYDPASVPAAILNRLSADPEASTYQFVVVAHPLTGAGLPLIQDRARRMVHELEVAKSHAAELRAELDRVKQAHTERAQQEADRIEAEADHAARRHANEMSEAARVRAALEMRVEELIRENDAYRESLEQGQHRSLEADALRETIRQQNEEIANLKARVGTLFERERDLREMLLDAHDQLMRRDEEIAASLPTLIASPSAVVPASAAELPQAASYVKYQQTLKSIRELVRQAIPEGGHVLAVSRGDEDVLRLEHCRAAHFPQGQGGVYAGYHPANSEVAITHLTELQKSGAQYLLIPHSSLWWLDHYREFADHLNSNFHRVVDQPDVCIVFDLGHKPHAVAAAQAKTSQAEPLPSGIVIEQLPPEPRPFGVNLCGHIGSEKGTGESARATIRELESIGVPVALNNFCDASAVNPDSEFTAFVDENPYSVNLIHANADALADLIRWKSAQYFEGRYNIGFWAWELSRFPKKWLSVFDLLNEIWVPSTFVLDSVSRVSSVPVVVMPHSLPKPAVIPTRGVRSRFGLGRDEFLFLFMFDFMSILERKNPFGLIRAFRKAFRNRDRARLVLKVSHAETHPHEWREFEEAARHENITIINGVFPREDITKLLNVCNCYVSLHRAEGFGLTLAEAMNLAKPVIATGYSGNMDFMTPANSFLVKYRMVPLDRDYPPYEQGSMWADPSEDHAAELMRQAFEKRQMAEDVGKQAQRDIQERFSISAVAAMIRERFATLGETGRLEVPDEIRLAPAPPPPKCREPEVEYRRMIRKTLSMINGSTPEGATVMVISNGDSDLVSLKGRRGWHFPRQDDGAYSGFHPGDSVAAIGYLEMLRAKGGQYLMVPRTAGWWLEHYAEFRQHLDQAYRKVKSNDAGVLYELAKPALSKQATRLNARALPASETAKRKVNGSIALANYA